MQRNNGDMIIQSSTHDSFESSATVESRQRISNIYIYLYVSDQAVFIGSEVRVKSIFLFVLVIVSIDLYLTC